MFSRLCPARTYFIQTSLLLKSAQCEQIALRNNVVRTFNRSSRSSVRPAKAPTLWERAMAPAGPNAFGIGKGMVAGASALGIGALCFYGLGLSSQPGTLEQSHLWPQYVKDRVKDTYMYFGGSLVFTAGTAMAAFRTPAVMNLVTRGGWLALAGSLAAMIGTGMLMRSVEYKPGVGPKQFAWMLHSGVMGALLAPMCFLGGPLLIRAAWYTAGIVGGLSTIAICAPSEQFLTMGAPLAMGFGVVFASSIASMFLPATSALGAGIYSISLYGGLILFSGLMLYDTQRIIKRAEQYPVYGFKPFDPINSAMSIYMDTLNIFIRIASMLAGGGSRK